MGPTPGRLSIHRRRHASLASWHRARPCAKSADSRGYRGPGYSRLEDDPMKRLVTTTSLEMTHRAQLRPAARGRTAMTLVRAEIPCPEFNRFLYATVGFRWWWYTRLSWDHARWLAYLDRPEVETWV